MKKSYFVLALTLTFLYNTSAFSNQRQSVDLAINIKSGENFILEKSNNPNATLIIKNDKNLHFHQEIDLLEINSHQANVEIDLSKDGKKLYYVINQDNLWSLNYLEKINNKWVKSSKLLPLTGTGLTNSLDRNLIANQGGILFLNIVDSHGPKTLVITDNQGTLEVKKEVTPNQIRATVKELQDRGVLTSIVNLNDTPGINEETNTQNNEETNKYESGNGAGFAAGAISGVGFAYRRHFANKWGIQVAGIALGSNNDFSTTFGVNFLRTLSKKEKTRFYLIMGSAFFYNVQNQDSQLDHNLVVNLGFGLGIEWNFSDDAHLSFELPIHLLYDLDSSWQVMYIPSVSLIYYF